MSRDPVQQGSQTAKQGFQNEADVIEKFNNRKNDPVASARLQAMGYDLQKIASVRAVKVPPGQKTDVQVQVRIEIQLQDAVDLQNISVKLVSNRSGFNQIDKRRLKKYVDLRNIPAEVTDILQHFCGEKPPCKPGTRDPRRMFIDEMTETEQNTLLEFLKANQMLIVSDILKGRGEFCAERMLVVKKTSLYERVLQPINAVMNFFGNGDIKISPRGSIQIGKITMQRKGGDGGRPSANMLQFKIDPTELFNPIS